MNVLVAGGSLTTSVYCFDPMIWRFGTQQTKPVVQPTTEVMKDILLDLETKKVVYKRLNCVIFLHLDNTSMQQRFSCAGTLASIHSWAENWFIWEKLQETEPEETGRNFWLGMRKHVDEPVDPEESKRIYQYLFSKDGGIVNVETKNKLFF